MPPPVAFAWRSSRSRECSSTRWRNTSLSSKSAPWIGLTLDVGHVHCQDEGPIADRIQHWEDVLWNVHIEDMRHGVHDHLLFGEGEIDFRRVLAALKDIRYSGGVYVELSRHSHDAVNTARKALSFLRRAME